LLVSLKKLKNTVIIGKETIRAINKELKNQTLYFVIQELLSYKVLWLKRLECRI